MEEIWKAIPGFESFYEISNLGRVRSLPRKVPVRAGGHRLTPVRILKPWRNQDYLRVTLAKDGVATKQAVHRIVAYAFCEKAMGTEEVIHLNDIRTDNRAANLRWVVDAISERPKYLVQQALPIG